MTRALAVILCCRPVTASRQMLNLRVIPRRCGARRMNQHMVRNARPTSRACVLANCPAREACMRLASKPACQVNKIPASATPYRGLGEFRFRRDELLVVEETGVLPTRRCARVWACRRRQPLCWIRRAQHPVSKRRKATRSASCAACSACWTITAWPRPVAPIRSPSGRARTACGACGTPSAWRASSACAARPVVIAPIRASRRP